MAYELDAVLGELDLLQTLAHNVPVVALNRGFALIPLTDEVVGILTEERSGLDDVFKHWSAQGPIIHVTARMHGGYGGQTARIFRDGDIVFAQDGLPYSGPISMALQRLGVTGGRIGADEFDIVGLSRRRWTERWVTDQPPPPK